MACADDDASVGPGAEDTIEESGWSFELWAPVYQPAHALRIATDGTGEDVILASDGTVHLAVVVDGDLYHYTDASGAWTAELVDCELSIREPSIAVDAAGSVHVAYVRWTRSELWYATNATGGFVHERVAFLERTYWDTPEIAVASDRSVHLLFAWYGPAPRRPFPRMLGYAAREPGGWSAMTIADAVGLYALAAAEDPRVLATQDDPDESPVSQALVGTRAGSHRVDQDCDGVDGIDRDGDGRPDEP